MKMISRQYRELNAELHRKRGAYGTSGHLWLGPVLEVAEQYDCQGVLDYGCGKGTLGRMLRDWSIPLAYAGYDPAVKEFAEPPPVMDLVVALDVMEHIEPEKLHSVLGHIHDLSGGVALFVISLRAAQKKLPDGRNAHLIIQNRKWWRRQLETRFNWLWERAYPDTAMFIMEPKR